MSIKEQAHQRILSIQSHVTFGYVGGKAATFPLQLLGYDVDVVNTVHFSNHAGYRRHGGTKTTAAELAEMFHSMKQNEMIIAGRLLTGFVPDADCLSEISQLATELRKTNPNLIYLLDPVLGDAGIVYVDDDTIPIYRSMLPLATAITPNWFEAELLTETKIQDLPSLRLVIKILHEKYHVPNVVISSMPVKPWLLEVLPKHLLPPSTTLESDTPFLICISSSATVHMSSPSVVHAQLVPVIPGYYSGVGDLFSALLLGHYHADSNTTHFDDTETPLSVATSLALMKTHTILSETYKHTRTFPEEERHSTDDEMDALDPLRRTRRMRGRELRLVQNQDLIKANKLDADSKRLVPWVGFW